MPNFGDLTEKASDAGIEKAGDIADAKTGGTHDAQIDKVEKELDAKIGD